MKNFNDIEALLDRYWEGETTLEEERALKAYFASGDVDERLRAVAPFFQALREEQTVRYAKAAPLRPVHFAWQKLAVAASVALLLSAGLWWWASREKTVFQEVAQQTPVQQEQIIPQENPILKENKTSEMEEPKSSPFAKRPPVRRKKTPTCQPLTPEEQQAMEEIKAALALVSSKMRKGRQEAAKGAIHLENVDKVFKKNS
jgi:hypothetical protein